MIPRIDSIQKNTNLELCLYMENSKQNKINSGTAMTKPNELEIEQ